MPDNIVYSTDPAWQPPCPACGRTPCGCKSPSGKPKQAEPVRVSFRRGHKGSGLTMIEKLQMHPAGKEELLKKFKKRLGVGGAVKFGVLELQGDHRDSVETELKGLGYKVRRLG
jgi:translation initiation factor 1